MQEDVNFLTESFATNQAIKKGYVPQSKHVLGYVFVFFAYACKDFNMIELEITFLINFWLVKKCTQRIALCVYLQCCFFINSCW